MEVAAHPQDWRNARTSGDAGDTGAGNGDRGHTWEGWLFESNTLCGDRELTLCGLNSQGLHRLWWSGGIRGGHELETSFETWNGCSIVREKNGSLAPIIQYNIRGGVYTS